jgi:hypothetical protein
MKTQIKSQSLSTALRHVRAIIRKAEQTDFTSAPEDVALQTLCDAAMTMYSFLRAMSRTEAICDCVRKGWQGEGHHSACNVTSILRLLSDLGKFGSDKYYVLYIEGDVDPYLHGPFKTEDERDSVAKRLRAADRDDIKSGIYPLDCSPGPHIGTYSAAFFKETEDADAIDG